MFLDWHSRQVLTYCTEMFFINLSQLPNHELTAESIAVFKYERLCSTKKKRLFLLIDITSVKITADDFIKKIVFLLWKHNVKKIIKELGPTLNRDGGVDPTRPQSSLSSSHQPSRSPWPRAERFFGTTFRPKLGSRLQAGGET